MPHLLTLKVALPPHQPRHAENISVQQPRKNNFKAVRGMDSL
jgi:hypothetical protein